MKNGESHQPGDVGSLGQHFSRFAPAKREVRRTSRSARARGAKQGKVLDRNQVFWPENHVFQPEIWVFWPENKVSQLENRVFWPENTVFWPENLVLGPRIAQMHLPWQATKLRGAAAVFRVAVRRSTPRGACRRVKHVGLCLSNS